MANASIQDLIPGLSAVSQEIRKIRIGYPKGKMDFYGPKHYKMSVQDDINYQRIAQAIEYIQQHFKEQPTLDQIARAVNLSPFHFQKLFTDWAGTTPKKFLQYVSAEYAKKLLKAHNTSLFEAAYETGLSGTSRLHDLFIKVEGMTPAEYRDGGSALTINYSLSDTPFGKITIASTSKGICFMSFEDQAQTGLEKLQQKFPNAAMVCKRDPMQDDALSIFKCQWDELPRIKLHLKGSAFQLKVWEALLKVPAGRLTTYGAIAKNIDLQNASRAVGTAVGSNPVAFLIPCHRVIQSTGALGGYMWGTTRKAAIIGWEGLQFEDPEKGLRATQPLLI